MEGTTASVLLLYGGLTALQSATTITGLAFAIILVIMVISFYMSLEKYHDEHFSSKEKKNA
jgi:choline/glycine/proline betaine transport protein